MPQDMEHTPPELDIGQDMAFQRMTWKLERVGWIVLTLLLLAAVAGFFGSGPLSRGRAGDPASGLWVEYERFARTASLQTLRVHVGAQHVREGKVTLWIARAYLDDEVIEDITPTPESVHIGKDGIHFIYSVADAATQADVVIRFKTQEWGGAEGRLAIPAGPSVMFKQFIYP